jgi:hypothetical protein
MARGLTLLLGPAPTRRRRVAWLALLIGVIVVHGYVTQGVADRMAGLIADQALPPRIEVPYVREMALSAPPPTAAPAAPPPAAAPVAPRPRKPKPPKPASAPEPQPVEAVVAAASAPVAEPAIAVATETAAASAPPAASAASSAGGAPFEWPTSTRVSYLLTGNYRGEVNGSAQVEWIRVGSHYQVHVDFIVGPTLAPLITQRSTSDGEITAGGLAPRRYDQDIRFLMNDRPRQTVLFDAGYVVLANGDVRTALPGVQDTASQFVQLTYLFSTRPELLRVGGSVDIPLALPKKMDVWTYDVVEQQVLNTPLGPLTGIHLKPRGEHKAGTLSVEMWFAPQLQYFPARLRFEQDAQTYVDLLISRPPEVAN